jgi:hypothetical protein
LGVLEDTPGHYSGDPHYRSVRVVFRREAQDWKAFPSNCLGPECAVQYPPAMDWTIAFDGRRVGRIDTSNTDGFDFYSDVGQQKVAGAEPVPTVGKQSQEFAGSLNGPVYRPLIANSKPYFRDPEQWKTAELSSEVVELLRKQFRLKFPKVSNCENPEENIEKPRLYKDENIRITKAYSSNMHWAIARVQLEQYRCDGPTAAPFVDQWFSISPNREIKFLDKAMWLVDAGDYDNDGRSELVFSIDDYNRGGYRLFYNNFEKRAVFEFSYH